MRYYYDFRLGDRTIDKREMHGEEIVKAGRYFIAKTLLDLGAATVDPLSPENPLIFSAGTVRGHQLLQCQPHQRRLQEPADRRHQGSQRRRQLQLWPRPAEDRRVHAARRLARTGWSSTSRRTARSSSTRPSRTWARATSRPGHAPQAYGKKVTIALCGPVGEYQGLIAGIAFSDKDGRPSRLSARGGVGAVMGAKKVKAIVVDLDKIPPFHDPKKVNASIKDYAKMLLADSMVSNFYQKIGTMGMADIQNAFGGLPVRNFSAGQMAERRRRREVQDGRRVHQRSSTSRAAASTHMRACRAA